MTAVLMIALLSFLCIIALLSNMLVLVVLASKSTRITVRDVILMSLAAGDVVQTSLGFPVEIYGYAIGGSSDSLCVINGFTVTCLALYAISLITCLSLERFFSIKYPLKAQVWFAENKSGLYFVIPSFINGFLWSMFPLVGWNEYSREVEDPHRCTMDLTDLTSNKQSYILSLMFACYFLPVSVIVFCCIATQWELSKMAKRAQAIAGEASDITRASHKAERQNFMMVILMTVCFLLAWTPYAFAALLMGLHLKLPLGLLSYSALFAKTATLFNPIIYCILYKDFRVSLQNLLPCLRGSTVAPA